MEKTRGRVRKKERKREGEWKKDREIESFSSVTRASKIAIRYPASYFSVCAQWEKKVEVGYPKGG